MRCLAAVCGSIGQRVSRTSEGAPRATRLPARGSRRHLAPLLAVKGSPARFRRRAAPLFEEERDPRLGALISDCPYPLGPDRTMTGPALAADDYPGDAVERKMGDWAGQGLHREEPDDGRDLHQVHHA